ncbi:putative gibberellin 20-oxidase [Tothia fuscella]|uniref:Gibberellin 20-oxidase n=1 Tax=Tothia fuscella TaxID=1048955 RepID=A0A9P4TSQ6_9PEZI|nr:putative gibberellin 20-oxidase [Tothia fuscella]
MELPLLNMSAFRHGKEMESIQFSHRLLQSFTDHGFVKLINHGLPKETVKAYMKAAEHFFKLPTETKMKIANKKGPWPQRGFSWAGAGQTSKLMNENLVGESWDELKDARPNRWPSEDDLPGKQFRTLMEKCYDVFQATCIQLMEAMELGLKLPKGALVERCKPASSELRLNHYPETDLQILAKGKTKRTWPHTDFGIITLLFQDQVGGLGLQDRRNPQTFVPVLPGPVDGPTEMVVNISNTFQRCTNDVVRAGVHQVSVPVALKEKKTGFCPERYSGVFFFKAYRTTSVGPLTHFISDKSPAVYEEINALQYQQKMTGVLY